MWLSDCTENHKCYSVKTKPVLPTRIIAINMEQDGDARIMLGNGRRGDYFALSYCWGAGTHPHSLTTRNRQQYMTSLPIYDLPNTLANAINITRRLGLQFLWIDALCIVQDDDRDWQRESAKMAEVYGNAFCTISATGASNSATGCYSPRSALSISAASWHLYGSDTDQKITGLLLIPGLPEWDISVNRAPLNNRAWTLQERALSHRIIHWTKHKLVWECQQQNASETWPSGIPDSVAINAIQDGVQNVEESQNYPELWRLVDTDGNGLLGVQVQVPTSIENIFSHQESIDDLMHLWRAMVIEASGRHLTKDSDILPALSGLAQIVQKRTRQNYLAGHWQSDLPTSILWRALNTTKIPLPKKHRASTFPAPTWSWASIVGQIVFPDKSEQVHSEYLPGITILKASTTLAGLDPFGHVTGGYLKVSGKSSRTLAAKHTYGTTGNY